MKNNFNLVIYYLNETLELIIKDYKQKNLFEDPGENMI